MPRLASIAFFVASTSILRPSTTSGFLYAGIGPGIEAGTPYGYARGNEPKASMLSLAKNLASKRTQNECCAALLLEENLVPRTPDGDVELPPSCLKEGAFCNVYEVYGPTPAPPPPDGIEGDTASIVKVPDLPTPVDATESDMQDDIEGDTASIVKVPDLPTPVDATESDMQANHPKGSGISGSDDSKDCSKNMTVTNDEVDNDISWLDGEESLLPELPYVSPSGSQTHRWKGYIRPRFSRVKEIIVEPKNNLQTHGLKGYVRPRFSDVDELIVEPEGALQTHGCKGYARPRFSGVDEVIVEAEGEASDDTPIPSAERVLYEYTMETGEVTSVVVPISSVKPETHFFVFKSILYGYDDDPESRLISALVRQRVQASSGDRPPKNVEVINVVVPAVDIDADKKDYFGYRPHTALGVVQADVVVVNVDFEDKVSSKDRPYTALEAVKADVPAVDVDGDSQLSPGDRPPTACEASDVAELAFDIESDGKDVSADGDIVVHEEVNATVTTVNFNNSEKVSPGDRPPMAYEASDVAELAFDIESDGKAISADGDIVVHEEANATVTTVNFNDGEKVSPGDRPPTAYEASDVAELAFDIESDGKDGSADGDIVVHEEANATVTTVNFNDGEKVSPGDRPPAAYEASDVAERAFDIGSDGKVDRVSVWATDLTDIAKDAEPTCAVGEAQLDEVIHVVPARASVDSSVDDGRPSSAVDEIAPRPWGWKWGNIVAFTCIGVQVASLVFLATLPLRVGDKVTPRVEDMAFWKRLIAVFILRKRAKRPCDRKKSQMLQILLGLWICRLWGTWYAFVLAAALMVTMYVATSPRQARFPVEQYIDQVIFELLQDYFAVNIIMEDETAFEEYAHGPGKCMIAKFPLGMAEVVHDVLGMRRARKGNCKDMFADGREGVAVVTDGAEEPFVSEAQRTSKESTTQLVRKTCTGQDTILPVYVSGASRTHPVVPGRIHRIMKALCSKVPGLLFCDAIGPIPYRQQLTIVVGRPIRVWRATFKDVIAKRTCTAVDEALLQLAEKNRPEWEKRQTLFTRGAAGW